jgi:hypothetical protein
LSLKGESALRVWRGGSALAAAGMSSKPTTETSWDTEIRRSVIHSIAPSASWSLKARMAVGSCSERNNASMARYPSSLALP